MSINRRLQRTRVGLGSLRQGQAAPPWIPAAAVPDQTLSVLYEVQGGETLATVGTTDYDGVGIPTTPPEFVATAEPPTSGWAAGLGRARLNATDGDWVWVSSRCRPKGSPHPIIFDALSVIYNGSTFISRTIARMPIGTKDGTTFAPVYMLYGL